LQSNALKQALQPYCIGGPYGRLLDADAERLGAADVQLFETEGLIGRGAVTDPRSRPVEVDRRHRRAREHGSGPEVTRPRWPAADGGLRASARRRRRH
jgi:hypothetical protein